MRDISVQEFLEKMYFNNTVEDYIWFIVTLVISFLVIQIVKKLILNRIYAFISKRSKNVGKSLIPKIRKYLPIALYVGAIYLSLKTLVLSVYFRDVMNVAFVAVYIFLAAIISIAVIEFLLTNYEDKIEADGNKYLAVEWIGKFIKALIWILAVILFLENIGVEISALVAGLGVGGIAIAFAAQAILEDIFSYFTIFFDRPYEIGDFLITGDYLGTVEYIGIRTTRLRSLSGEQLVFSNKDLTNARIRNYKSMEQRRVVFSLGVTYDTPLATLKEIPGMLKEIVEAQENVRFDRAHFFKYGDSSLNYEIVYYVLASDYNIYMDIQQTINLEIFEAFEAKDIEFAFPTRTLYLQKEEAKSEDQWTDK